ncbi:branched chain amino acid ABC transporter substrate-binding protein [Pseudomonas amygdali pv. eriobotryae]|uniref:Branched chain amino acid ABC transporter substrate-binding protein n=2 Tax=Pseudomonas amygdali TaxID=47877 RepID=A0A0P9PSU9_PSEA0|nr:Extracellular ligand-binding receptor [Pseudomonas amygdali pv. eriobotryae]KWS78378.1 branched chain amino acid ABC transporter substrate-binding protein [Pseudomonas amygdali pv. eriobotryae]RMM02435.1 Extracellular ligand-binding receptor [Pseudomonas amygdali pv. eriobotryae]RMO66779.1 Extracellular ligand-binding receptor [Pseudomonas amygdali pv. eriobotryae]GFZ62785.1 branched chain amino acid ABC transporter substrate-binding protein [Pseudomonas amygdali pv. eriobotryae]
MSGKAKPTLVSLVMAIALASGSVHAEVIIGVAGPMTGTYSAYGDQVWRGAQAAADAINSDGGINGEKIRLVKGDDACDPKQAVAVANRLVESDKVVAVIGHFCSSSVIPTNDIYADAGIISISPAATNPKVTERGLQTVFRNCGRDDQQGIVAGDYIVDVLKAKRIVIIHDKDTYGQGLADATKLELNKKGVNEVLYEGLTRGEKDFNALVTKIRSVSPDVVYFGGLHPEAGPLVRQLREQGVTAKFISGDGIFTDELVSAAGGAQYVNGVMMTFGADPRNNPAGKSVVEKFRADGYEPEGYTLYSYSSVQAVAVAFAAIKGTNGEKASVWLKSHPVATAIGTKEWDKNGDLKVSGYVMYQWGPDGKYKQL